MSNPVFGGKNKKNIMYLSSDENAQRVVKVNESMNIVEYSRLLLSRSQRDSLKYFEISVLDISDLQT